MGDGAEDDPFAVLRRGLRGEADERSGVAVRPWVLGAGGVVLLVLAIVVLTAARPAPAPEAAEPLVPSMEAAGATTIAAAGAAPARVWPAEPVTVEGTEVRTGGHRWQVGEPGDLVAVGDWDCDGTATPAVVRPSAGRMHLFDRWASADAPVSARPGPAVPADAASFEPDGCGAAVIRSATGATQRVDTMAGA
jgi:hypothetical protein